MLKRQGQLADDGTYIGPKASAAPPLTRVSKAEPAQSKSVLARIVNFFKEVSAELRKVFWPTRQEVVNYSILVFVALLFVALLVFGIDYGCTKAVLFLFKK